MVHRARLQSQALVTRAAPLIIERWLRLDPSEAHHRRGKSEALGQRSDGLLGAEGPAGLADMPDVGDVHGVIDWRSARLTRLQRFELHGWGWVVGHLARDQSATAKRRVLQLWNEWKEAFPLSHADAWHPFVASTRAWVLCTVFSTIALDSATAESDITMHGRFISTNLEFDVGGNHLVKNLKALVGCGVFLGNEKYVRKGVHHLERQLPVQVLSDGAHFELSPSYHAQVLGDFIDIENLLEADGRPPVPGLHDAIQQMRSWLAAMTMPDGDVAMLNDCSTVGRERLDALGVTTPEASRLNVLRSSGYVIARPDERLHVVADVAMPCPPQLPAHAQADCLTFELCVDGKRVIIDPGTSTYEPGERRMWERCTPAHNTVAIDGENQTEVWATFRAARLAKPLLERAEDDGEVITVIGSHNGYERLKGKPRHRRTWEMRAGQIRIIDEVTGRGRHLLTSRLQFAPNIEVSKQGERAVDAGPLRIRFDAPASASVHVRPPGHEPGGVAFDFGPTIPAAAVDFEWEVELPVSWTTTIEVVGDPP